DTVPDEVPAPTFGPSSRPDEDEPDGRAARKAVELLETRRDKPIFLAVGFLKPHDPWIVPEKYLRMYPPESVVLPEHGADEQIFGARLGAPMNIPPAQEHQALAADYASATFMDAQLGVILDAMDRRRLWEKTVVVLVGDNGMHVGEHGLFGKMTLFEASARVPMVIAAPGASRAGEPTDRLVEL